MNDLPRADRIEGGPTPTPLPTRPPRPVRAEAGQATVEVALTLPLVAMLLAIIVEVGVIAADRSRVWHAAREGARVAAVQPEDDYIRAAVERAGAEGAEVTIEPSSRERVQGEPVTVTVRYRHEGRVPLIGRVFESIVLDSSATMRIEKP